MKYRYIPWTQLQNDIFKLSEDIKKSKEKFDVIVAIATGGLTIAHILSDFLDDLPITSFTISTYKDFKTHQIPDITLKLGNKFHKQRILLVDDVSDTGKTFVRGKKYVEELGAEHIKTASVYIKPWTTFMPDYHIKEYKDWIVFPFDVRETIRDLKRVMKKEGKTDNQIKRKLETIGISKHYIALLFPNL